jgi:putative transposase
MKEKSKALKTPQDKDCMMSNLMSTVAQNGLPLFVTAELAPQSSEMTLTDKSLICNPSTQKQKSSKTSAQESTSKEKGCNPYWTDFCAGISSHLLLPVVTDLQDLDLNLCSTWLNKTVDKSWFSTQLYTAQIPNSLRIYSQSFTSFPVESTDLENTLKKSRKIYLSLTPVQKAITKQWFGVSRFVYNTTIKLLQDGEVKANWKAIKTDILNNLPNWCNNVPYQIKSIAIKDACKSVSHAKKKYKNGGGISKCRFRSRKQPIQNQSGKC